MDYGDAIREVDKKSTKSKNKAAMARKPWQADEIQKTAPNAMAKSFLVKAHIPLIQPHLDLRKIAARTNRIQKVKKRSEDLVESKTLHQPPAQETRKAMAKIVLHFAMKWHRYKKKLKLL
ncbi:hypothetical protein BCIN_02g09360 [Botrytis cinerea B05.10]|uniref:Uncharacterized protein n=1 Tax=Botryotinia fuckeliana (strain B05.10) TaxID=332648 RepID=A0A384JB11_BOTFB|nr:hypothetical protein BCIN_02g09360 [Botrytis cinerea B05.10]ATZ47680.1 hypothetical protein BCIN_02g09360 [Botrytis cinerea B05.10]